MERVYMTKAIPAEHLARITGYDLGVWRGEGPVPRDRLLGEVGTARGLLTMLTDRIDADLLEAAPVLEVISQMAVGVDNIDVAACRRRGIRIGHTPGVLTETVADSAFALLAAIVRRLPEGEREVRAGEWGPWEIFHLAGGDLHGTTLGIVGMGRIGKAVARRARGFDMEVIYSSPDDAGIEARRVTLPQLLVQADHVILCPRLDDSTRGLISTEELAMMKPESYLVNVARGPVVDSDALVAALTAGNIAGAALDVTDPEPLPPDHPLLALDNCLVVPHIASASVRTRLAMSSLAVDNLVAGLSGGQMPSEYPVSG
ncbi:MAG TPA: D-glycerate dehydrogenase [Acidimicrobiia bacterium]|nr:D-glycerate dehydrogenase [Acidimicrobiia bacterium]